MKEIFLNLPDITLTVELLESIVKANEDKLERIIDSISVPKECNSVQLIAKLKRIINNEEEVLAPYEILMLSFSCAALSKDDLSFYLEMFADKHKSLDLLQGLIFSLIRVWNNYDCRSLLISFIAKNKSLLNKRLSDVSSFFLYDDGPRLLGSAMRNKDIFAAPKMICMDCEWINSDYFAQVILKYFNEKPISHEILKTIESLLKKIAKVRLNKLLLPDIVIRFDQESKNESLRNTLTSLCLRMIGTIEEPTRWEESSFDEKQRRALVNCKNIIKRWQVERSISLVFDKIGGARYPDRSRYWKRFASSIDRIKIYTTEYVDKSMRVGIPAKYFGRQLSGTANTALLMGIGNWTIVELLEGGCAYFYHDEPDVHPNMHKYVWNNSIDTIEDLLNRKVPLVITSDVTNNYLHIYPNNCKINHMGDWQYRFNKFMTAKEVLPYNKVFPIR